MLEGAVAPVVLDRDQSLQRVAGWREERQVALGGERAAGGLGEVLVDHVAHDEVDGARGGEVPVLDEVRPFERLETQDGLGDQKVQVGVALAVGVAAEVDREPVDEERDVGAVIGVEAAQEVLLRLAVALMLADDEAGDQAHDIGRPTARGEVEGRPRAEELRGRGDGRRRRHHDRRQRRLLRSGRRFLGSGRRLLAVSGGGGHEDAAEQDEADDDARARRVREYEHRRKGNITRPAVDPVHFGSMGEERAVRFTVSVPARLMRTLDRRRAGRRYGNRSEFVRDLLRGELVKEEWAARPGETVGVLTLVYDHETHALADKLTDIQHHGYRTITASLHVHLDEHSCLEVIALRGSARRIRSIANQLLAVKGVRYGQLVPATRGKRLT